MSDDHPSPPTDEGSVPGCPACGRVVTGGERFCRSCGVRLADPGTQLPDGLEAGSEESAPPSESNASDVYVPGRDETTEIRPDASATTRQERSAVATAGDTGTPLRRCPNCTAPNSAQRELCGRCGADLETGTMPPRPEPRPVAARDPDARAERADDDPHGRRWGWAIAAVLGAAALVVGGLAVAGVGPFDRGPSVPQAVFEPDGYDSDAEVVPLSDIATMTTLPPAGDDRYDATQMVDDDRSTAWNSDGSQLPDGVGEKIDLFLDEPAWVDQIIFANGDQRDPDTYAANARIQRAQLTLDGGMTVVINLLDQGLQQQVIELRQPELTTTVRIEVLDTFPGDTHPDLAVSDLELRGWLADDGDAELAEERAAARRAAGASAEAG